MFTLILTGPFLLNGFFQPLAFLFIILALVVYIGYLHIQLNRKINYINTLLDRIMTLTSNLQNKNVDDILKKLVAIENSTIIPKDKIHSEDILNYIFSSLEKSRIFIHYTQDQQIAEKILQEGFRFVDSYYKTAERIYNDKIDFINKHNRHKHYGKFIIIISFAKEVFDYYEEEIRRKVKSNLKVEQVLTESLAERDENNELVYTTPVFFIKGYINYHTGEIVNNPVFKEDYDSLVFKSNIENM